MVMLQRCIFNRIFLPFYSCNQLSSKGLPSAGVPPAVLGGHIAAWNRSNSTLITVSSCKGGCSSGGRAAIPDLRERTLIAVKPDGVQRRLIGQVIQRFEQRGFKLVGLKMLQVSEDLLSQHYTHLRTKPFYPRLVEYMTSGPVVVMVWEGHKVVQATRTMVGHTNPAEAQAGTVRGDFSFHVSRNVVHASDSLETAQREIGLWFQKKELLNWDCIDKTITCEV